MSVLAAFISRRRLPEDLVAVHIPEDNFVALKVGVVAEEGDDLRGDVHRVLALAAEDEQAVDVRDGNVPSALGDATG